MAKLPKFTAKASRGAPPRTIIPDTGAGLRALSRGLAGLANLWGGMADKAAQREGYTAGLEHGSSAAVPTSHMNPAPGGGGVEVAGGNAGALVASARRLGVDPMDLATVISYETSGRFSASIRGGKNDKHIGLIQFGEEEQKKFGAHQGQTFTEQLGAVERYLKARGLKPGMGLMDLYSTINAGRPGLYHRSDGPGATVRSHVAAMRDPEGHRRNAEKFLRGALNVSPAAAAPVHVVTEGDGPEFSLSGSSTIRGQAFDRGASSVYRDRLDVQMRTTIDQLEQKHANDPEGLSKAIDSYVNGVASKIDNPADRVAIKSQGDRLGLVSVRRAARAAETERKNEAFAAYKDAFGKRRTDIIRTAMDAGTDDAGAAAIAGELESFTAWIDGQTTLTPAQRQAAKAGVVQDVLVGQVQGGFADRETSAGRAAYRQEFEKAWREGKGPVKDMTPEAFRSANAFMLSKIKSDAAGQARQVKAVERQSEQLMNRLQAGYVLPANELAILKAEVEATGDPVLAPAIAFLEKAANWQAENRQAMPADIDAQIAVLRAEMDKRGATPQAIEMVKVMQGLRKTIARGLQNDPLGLAERVGLGEIPALNTENRDNLVASLISRAAYADMVAQNYRSEPKYFRPGEAAGLQALAAKDPDFLPGFASAVSEAFGDRDISGALREISKGAPMLAHAAGVAVSTSSQEVLEETAAAVRRRALPDYKPVTLAPERQRRMSRVVAGSALQLLPNLESAAAQQAGLLFEMRAHGRGIDPKDINKEVQALWEGALNDALGRHEVDGEVRGGLGEVNRHLTFVPPEMSADTLQDMIETITPEDLDHLPGYLRPNGLPIEISRIRRGKLVAAGHGQYFVSLGDPEGAEPKWIQGLDGKPWRLDVFTLQVVQDQRARPGAVQGSVDPVLAPVFR